MLLVMLVVVVLPLVMVVLHMHVDIGGGRTIHQIPQEAEPAKSTQADIGSEDDNSNAAQRVNIKDEGSLHRLVRETEENNAIIGFFEKGADGGVKDREEENSAYQLFRKAATKNPKVPFAKVIDADLAASFGVDKLPAIVYMVIPENEQAIHMRRAQFFDDLTMYENDDPNRIFGTWTPGPGFKAWGPEQALSMLRKQM